MVSGPSSEWTRHVHTAMTTHPNACPLHLSTSLTTRGGISAVLQVYQRAGFFKEWRVHHVSSHTDQGGPIAKARAALGAAAAVWQHWLSAKTSVLHVHTASGPSFWRKLAIAAPVLLSHTPVVMHVHGGAFQAFFDRCGPVRRWLIRSALERSALVLGLTDEWVHTLRTIAPQARVQALVNPVEMPAPRRADAPPAPVRDTILYLGLLERKKGAHDLLEAFARLPQARTTCKLVLAGSGDIEGLRALAHSLGIADRVILPGWIGPKEKSHWLERAACLALPSYAEGLPMAILEAMAQGVPVVASAVGGIPQVVRPGETGSLVTPGDLADLTTQLSRIMNDEPLRQRMGEAGRQRIAERYSAQAVLTTLSQTYESLGLKRPHVPSPSTPTHTR